MTNDRPPSTALFTDLPLLRASGFDDAADEIERQAQEIGRLTRERDEAVQRLDNWYKAEARYYGEKEWDRPSTLPAEIERLREQLRLANIDAAILLAQAAETAAAESELRGSADETPAPTYCAECKARMPESNGYTLAPHWSMIRNAILCPACAEQAGTPNLF